MKMFVKGLVVAALAMLATIPARAEETEINFGIISTESQQNLKQAWVPFIEAMSKQTGVKVNPFFASDYAGIIEGMKFNKVQLAWYGNKSGMEAVDRSDGQVFAQSVNKDGTQGYYGLLITNVENTALNSVDDIKKCDKSLSFGNGDPNSTSGFLVPSVFVFTANRIEPKDCFKAVTNANHETNLMAVANKQVDFATNNTENLAKIEQKDPEAFKKIKVIWKSPLIPSDPIVWRKDLDPTLRAKFMTFFMSYGRQGTVEEVKAAREVLGALGWAPFTPSSDAQLYPIRVLEVTKSINKVNADDTLSQADKDAKLKELETKKAEFENLMGEVPQTLGFQFWSDGRGRGLAHFLAEGLHEHRDSESGHHRSARSSQGKMGQVPVLAGSCGTTSVEFQARRNVSRPQPGDGCRKHGKLCIGLSVSKFQGLALLPVGTGSHRPDCFVGHLSCRDCRNAHFAAVLQQCGSLLGGAAHAAPDGCLPLDQ